MSYQCRYPYIKGFLLIEKIFCEKLSSDGSSSLMWRMKREEHWWWWEALEASPRPLKHQSPPPPPPPPELVVGLCSGWWRAAEGAAQVLICAKHSRCCTDCADLLLKSHKYWYLSAGFYWTWQYGLTSFWQIGQKIICSDWSNACARQVQ